jgi:hypothetical protein
MVGATDQKTDWNLGETVAWIRTRDHNRVAGMWDRSEFEAVAFAFFDWRQLPRRVVRRTGDGADTRPPTAPAGVETASSGHRPDASAPGVQAVGTGHGNEQGSRSPTGRLEHRGASQADDLSGLDGILQDVMRKVQTRKVRMTMIRVGEAGVERIPVTAGEANELQLRITGDVVAPVIAWSRTQQATAGTSPWFSRTDIIRAWPELSKKTAAVAGALLRHLREISTPERPLTKGEALDRCSVEVPNAYPEAFKRAWAQLEPSRKRGRGKHGPRLR